MENPPPGAVRVTFLVPHRHAGKDYVVGDSIIVEPAAAERIRVRVRVATAPITAPDDGA